MCANTDKGFGVLVFWYVPGRGSGLSGSGFRLKFAFRVRGFGSTVSRRKAQGSGFKGSGFRLFKVQSAVLAAQGLGFGVWGLGLKAEGSGFRLQGFRLGGDKMVYGPPWLAGAMKYILRAIKWSTGCLGLIKTFIGLDKTAIGGDKMVYGQHSGAIAKPRTLSRDCPGSRPNNLKPAQSPAA